jgi:type IV pilus assembly protein PilZ
MVDSPNRRNETRHPAHLEVDCSSGDTFLYAYITDISSMGIFIRTDTPLPVGAVLELGFTPPASPASPGAAKADPPPKRLELTGEVMWNTTSQSDAANPGMGVRFHHTSPKTRARLLEIVRAIAYLDGADKKP